MLIQGTVFICETSFMPISPLAVNLVTTFYQYRHDNLHPYPPVNRNITQWCPRGQTGI